MVYRIKSGSYRPNVLSRKERIESAITNNEVEKQFSWYKYLTNEDIIDFTPKELTAIRRNHAFIRQCIQCHFYFLSFKKYDSGHPNYARGFRCLVCRGILYNTKDVAEKVREKSLRLQKIYWQIQQAVNREQGVKVYYVDPATL